MIPDTQRAAHNSIQPVLPEKRRRVLSLIPTHGGIALWELAERLGWSVNCVSGRVTELKDEGYIVDSRQRTVNPHTGKKAILWIRLVTRPQRQPDLFVGLDGPEPIMKGH